MCWMHFLSHPSGGVSLIRQLASFGEHHDLLSDAAFIDQFPERTCETSGKRRADLKLASIVCLQDEPRNINISNGRHLKIFGTPRTPRYYNWAFQYRPIRDVFSRMVLTDIDVLSTRGSPQNHPDPESANGCPHFLEAMRRKRRKLKLAVFGPIHARYGTEWVTFDSAQRAYEAVSNGKMKR